MKSVQVRRHYYDVVEHTQFYVDLVLGGLAHLIIVHFGT